MNRNIFAALALAAAACSVEPDLDRAGAIANGIAVDTLRFLPFGSRFVLKDSASAIAFLGYHAGYVCSRFLELGLKAEPEGNPPAYRPSTRVRLPEEDRCPVDSGNRDTAAAHVFRDGDPVRLANPAGTITDSARLVAGRLDSSSIRGVPDSNRVLTTGKLTYKDSSSLGRVLIADSLPACMYLNSAEWSKGTKDTVEVRITWVTVEPGSGAGVCDGAGLSDTIPVLPRRSLLTGTGVDWD